MAAGHEHVPIQVSRPPHGLYFSCQATAVHPSVQLARQARYQGIPLLKNYVADLKKKSRHDGGLFIVHIGRPSMLKVTVSIIPGGIGVERQIGVMHISNVAGGALANYECLLTADDSIPAHAEITAYPRWSVTVWDLVARAIAKTLSGQERLPRRPVQVEVPIHTDSDTGLQYVRMGDIPEPARTAFDRRMQGSTAPVISGETNCVYADDWLRFIELR